MLVSGHRRLLHSPLRLSYLGLWLRRAANFLVWLVLWPLVARSQISDLSGSSRQPIRFTQPDEPHWYEAELLALLVGFRNHLWRARAFLLLIRGILLIACLFVLAQILLLFGISVSPGLLIALGVLIAVWVVFVIVRQRISYWDAARVLDRRRELGERAGTAVELIRARATGPLTRRQIQDATGRVRGLGPYSTIGYRLPWADLKAFASLGVVLVLVAVIGALQSVLFTPPGSVDEFAVAPIEAGVDDFALPDGNFGDSEFGPTDFDPGELGVRQELSDLLAELEGLDLTEDEIQSRLADAQMVMQQRAEQVQRQRQALGDLADALQDNSSTVSAAEAIRKGDYASAAQSLGEIGQQSEQLSERARQDLAQRLSDAANRVQANNPDLANQMRRAAQALAKGDPEAINQALAELSQGVRQAGDQAEGMAAGQQATTGTPGEFNEDDLAGMPFPGEGAGTFDDSEFGTPNGSDPFGFENAPGQGPGEFGDFDGDGMGQPMPGQGPQVNASDGGPGAGSTPGNPTTGQPSPDRPETDGRLLQVRGRPGDGPSNPVNDSERVPLVSSSDGSVAGISGSGAAAGTIDPTNIRGESNFVPWEKRQIIRDYFSGTAR